MTDYKAIRDAQDAKLLSFGGEEWILAWMNTGMIFNAECVAELKYLWERINN